MNKLGATGDYPKGNMHATDEGGLRMGIGIVNGRIVFNFGTPVAWIGFGADEALKIAAALMEKANELRKAEMAATAPSEEAK